MRGPQCSGPIRRTELLHQKHSFVGAPPPPVWQLPSPGLWLPWRFLKQFKIFGLVLGNRSCTLMVVFFFFVKLGKITHWSIIRPAETGRPSLYGSRMYNVLCPAEVPAKEGRRDGTPELGSIQLSIPSPSLCFWHLGTLTNVIPSSPSGDGVFPGPSRRVSRLYLHVANRRE